MILSQGYIHDVGGQRQILDSKSALKQLKEVHAPTVNACFLHRVTI